MFWDQLQLFPTAPEAVNVSVRWSLEEGPFVVVVSVGHRAPSGTVTWAQERYNGLTADEALDVVAAVAAAALGVEV